MVNKCNYCKQTKECRKNKLYGDGAGVGYPCRYYATEWICKDCSDYHDHLEIEESKNQKKRIVEFVKMRDKKLKEIRNLNQGGKNGS